MHFSRNIVVIDSIEDISKETINQFIREGFAYVKLPKPQVETVLWKLHAEAINFFNLPAEKKEQDGIKLDLENIQGYVDRSKEKEKFPILHEQIFFRPHKPLGPFKNYQLEINEIQYSFWDEIAKPLLKLVFNTILEPHILSVEKILRSYDDVINNVFASLSLLYYPYTPHPELYECGLNEHTDQGFLTVLWINQESLQVWLDDDDGNSEIDGKKGTWCNLYPKEGYVVVNIGNALNAILSNRCNSAVHRVLVPKKERLSIATFYDPSSTYIMRDLISDKLLFGGSSAEYLKNHFSKTYSPTFAKIIDDRKKIKQSELEIHATRNSSAPMSKEKQKY